jgi:hypothetical protein
MYALELQSYNTGCKARIGAPIATYERAANLARSVSNDPFWRVYSQPKNQYPFPFTVAVAGGWLAVVRL